MSTRLRFTRSFAGLVVAAFIGGGGCGEQQGHTIATFAPNSNLLMTSAPEDGRYALYTAAGLTPVTTYSLQKGDPLGFRRNANGQIEAVAGSTVQPLSKMTASAFWKEE